MPACRIDPRVLVRAWLLTAALDGLFSSVLTVVFYHSTFARLWQGVAATIVGPSAFDRGASTVWLGLVMHFGVAFLWSAIFLGLVVAIPALRRAIASRTGVVAVSVVYGPLVWITMSSIVIPLLLGHSIPHAGRWWIQLVGHIPFVGMPIVGTIGLLGRENVAGSAT